MSAAAAQLAEFPRIARDLEYQPVDGGAWTTLRGVLRHPTTDELVGGLGLETRIVVFRARELQAIGTPKKGDSIRDGTRVYRVRQDWVTRWAGPNPTFAHAEVEG